MTVRALKAVENNDNQVSQYQNVCILDVIGANDDGGGGDSYNTCKAPVKSTQSRNQHVSFYKPDVLPVVQPTMSKQ